MKEKNTTKIPLIGRTFGGSLTKSWRRRRETNFGGNLTPL